MPLEVLQTVCDTARSSTNCILHNDSCCYLQLILKGIEHFFNLYKVFLRMPFSECSLTPPLSFYFVWVPYIIFAKFCKKCLPTPMCNYPSHLTGGNLLIWRLCKYSCPRFYILLKIIEGPILSIIILMRFVYNVF